MAAELFIFSFPDTLMASVSGFLLDAERWPLFQPREHGGNMRKLSENSYMDVSENGHTPKIIQLNRIFFMRPTLGNYFEVEPGSGIFF